MKMNYVRQLLNFGVALTDNRFYHKITIIIAKDG